MSTKISTSLFVLTSTRTGIIDELLPRVVHHVCAYVVEEVLRVRYQEQDLAPLG
jgi:hypothetical protein